jgi:hypothetical protein
MSLQQLSDRHWPPLIDLLGFIALAAMLVGMLPLVMLLPVLSPAVDLGTRRELLLHCDDLPVGTVPVMQHMPVTAMMCMAGVPLATGCPLARQPH